MVPFTKKAWDHSQALSMWSDLRCAASVADLAAREDEKKHEKTMRRRKTQKDLVKAREKIRASIYLGDRDNLGDLRDPFLSIFTWQKAAAKDLVAVPYQLCLRIWSHVLFSARSFPQNLMEQFLRKRSGICIDHNVLWISNSHR